MNNTLRRYIEKVLYEQKMQPIMDPLFNVREICKEFTLLEDHLNQPEKRCHDCINKHLLKVEALAEEAISLDQVKSFKFLLDIPQIIRGWHNLILSNDPRSYEQVSSKIRILRKILMPYVVDHFN
jgi:hypothetical protein